MEFREWALEEGLLNWFKPTLKSAIPLIAISSLLNIPKPESPKELVIMVNPEEFDIRIPESEHKGFEFFIKDYAPVEENDIKIINLHSKSTKLGASASLAALQQNVDIKGHVAKKLNKESSYGFKSIPSGSQIDYSRRQELPKKIIRVVIEDWPVMTGASYYDPIYVTGSIRLNIKQGEGWIAPTKGE